MQNFRRKTRIRIIIFSFTEGNILLPVVVNERGLLIACLLLQGPGTDLVTDDRRAGQLGRAEAGHREAELPLDGEPGVASGDTEGGQTRGRLQAVHCDL